MLLEGQRAKSESSQKAMRVRQSRITEQKTISILMVSEVLKAD
jgi:hypothetical protein